MFISGYNDENLSFAVCVVASGAKKVASFLGFCSNGDLSEQPNQG